MSQNKEAQAHLIIHSFATASAIWAGLMAAVPVLGPLLADTTGLTLLTVGMVAALASLCELKLSQAVLNAIGSVAVGFILGNAALKVFASLLPIVGSGFNAVTTFGITEGIGWAIFWMFRDVPDIANKSEDELKKSLEKRYQEWRGGRRPKKENIEWINKLPSDVKQKYDELVNKLANKDISHQERTEILREIDTITKPYQPDGTQQ